MERHRNQTVNFRQSAFPLNGQAVPFLFKTRYQSLNVGDLFEFLADCLWNLTAVRTDSLNFTLVNVTSPFAGFSHGSSPPPPELARPFGKALLLTFATSSPFTVTQAAVQNIRRTDVRRRAVHITQWGPDGGQDYVTIAVNGQPAHDLGLVNLQPNQLQYIYNTIGVLTKSFMTRQTKYQAGTDNYSEFHGRFNLHALRSRLGRMPLPHLFRTVPYPLWPFSIPLWTMAPNMIPQRCITPEVALYYFMYLRPILSVAANVVGDVKVRRLGLNTENADGIAGHLSDSIMNFVQMVKTPGDTQLTHRELLAPAVIQSFMMNGTGDLECGSNYLNSMSTDALKFATSLSAADLGSLFLPADLAAARIMRQDSNFADTLLNTVTLSTLQ